MRFHAIVLAIVLTLSPIVLLANEPVKLGGEQQADYQRIKLKAIELRLQQQLLQVRSQLLKLGKKPSSQAMQTRTGLQWVAAKPGQLPPDPVLAGYGKDGPIYICHTHYKGGVQPGQVMSTGCRISYAGKAFIVKDYDVMAGKGHVDWQRSASLYRFKMSRTYPMGFNTGPVIFTHPVTFEQPQPIIGGHETNRILYICRVVHNNSIYIGKVVEGYCNIGDQQKEYREPTYQVLFSKPPSN